MVRLLRSFPSVRACHGLACFFSQMQICSASFFLPPPSNARLVNLFLMIRQECVTLFSWRTLNSFARGHTLSFLPGPLFGLFSRLLFFFQRSVDASDLPAADFCHFCLPSSVGRILVFLFFCFIDYSFPFQSRRMMESTNQLIFAVRQSNPCLSPPRVPTRRTFSGSSTILFHHFS